MGKVLDVIDDEMAAWLCAQPLFFVATAPRSDAGHVNCSPKGGDAFRVLGPRQAAYLDYTGSGVETIAHVRENGRILLMFCAFQGPPNIVRLHGRGTVLTPADAAFAGLSDAFPRKLGQRAIVVVDVTRISTSCGFAVPLMRYERDRDTLDRWAEAKGPDGLVAYRAEKNARSIDDLPGLS